MSKSLHTAKITVVIPEISHVLSEKAETFICGFIDKHKDAVVNYIISDKCVKVRVTAPLGVPVFAMVSEVFLLLESIATSKEVSYSVER